MEGHLLLKHLPQTSSSRKPVHAQGKNINVITQIKKLVPFFIILIRKISLSLEGRGRKSFTFEEEIVNLFFQLNY